MNDEKRRGRPRKPPRIRRSIDLPPDLDAAMQEAAKRAGLTFHAFIVRAITTAVEAQPLPIALDTSPVERKPWTDDTGKPILLHGEPLYVDVIRIGPPPELQGAEPQAEEPKAEPPPSPKPKPAKPQPAPDSEKPRSLGVSLSLPAGAKLRDPRK